VTETIPTIIPKNSSIAQTVRPNLEDYEAVRESFAWDQAQSELSGLPEGGLNIAYEAIDRHAAGPLASRVALRWLAKDGRVVDYTYADLKNKTDQFANLLGRLGVKKGDRVFSLAGRLPELYIAALGTLKAGAVFCPLFSAFGPEPIFSRMNKGEARLLVTTKSLYKRKIRKLRERLPELQNILLIDGESQPDDGVWSFPEELDKSEPDFPTPNTGPEDMALLHFTSGTTGMPKGAVHVHQAVLTHYVTGKYVMDFHPDDIFWCTADPGWVTGTSYGIIAPLVHGLTNIIDEADFNAERWFNILQEQKVTVWYTAPTAIRMLMRLDFLPKDRYDLTALRLIHSVGEPLNPEAVVWGCRAFGLPIHDNWWQSETGGIMIANYPSVEIRPGSMGKPLPGVEVAIVDKGPDGLEVVTEPGEEGELALRKGWPSMFRGYLHEKERYQRCFDGDWYLTGDLAKQDEDGYFWFLGRADDIIKTAGHMVSPFEVESALLEHPAVAEAAVIGKPEPTIGQIVKVFVSLQKGREACPELERELLGFARKKLGSAVAPKELEFQQNLPKTRSGKIMRRLLKARELGLPEGDISTLEGPSS
jgi:acetyl-CoA synthetase